MKKRLLQLTSIVGICSLLISVLSPVTAKADVTETDIQAELKTESQDNMQSDLSDYSLDELPDTYFPAGLTSKEYKTLRANSTGSALSYNTLINTGASLRNLAATASDSYYSFRDSLPTTKNQGEFDTCWAFATIALAEADLIKDGSANKSIDLSEHALSYYTYSSVNDPLGGLEGDNNRLNSSNYLNAGGDFSLAFHTLFTWKGLINESSCPYPTSSNVDTSYFSNNDAYANNVAHITNAYTLNIKENPASVKQMIIDHGGVEASYYASNSLEGEYYNLNYNSYFTPYTSAITPNHAITIVGWNDDFPASNFNTYTYPRNRGSYTVAPENNGAWLIRNSWQDTDGDLLYSYFWMSYDEDTLSEDVYALDFAAKGTDAFYDNNYQYDGGDASGAYQFPYSSSITGANVYTVSGKYESEILRAVSFETQSTNYSYSVKIYKNPTNSANPTSGSLESTVNGTSAYAGYITVPLSSPLTMDHGDVFAVVITIYNTSKPSLCVEIDYNDSPYALSVSSKANQSFIASGYSWEDYSKNGGNLRIKAYTNNSGNLYTGKKTLTLTYNNEAGDVTTSEYTSSADANLPTPGRDGYSFTGWFTNKELTVLVTENALNSAKKSLTLYAGWKANTYTVKFSKNGGKSGSMNPMSCTYGNSFTLRANAFKKTGYTFAGWNTAKNGKGTAYANLASLSNLSTTDGATVILYAQWTPIKYTIKFNGNGATSGKMSALKNRSYNKTYKLSQNKFTRKGKKFVGWSTNKKGKGKIYKNKASIKNLTSTNKKTVTLYAIWK